MMNLVKMSLLAKQNKGLWDAYSEFGPGRRVDNVNAVVGKDLDGLSHYGDKAMMATTEVRRLRDRKRHGDAVYLKVCTLHYSGKCFRGDSCREMHADKRP